MFTEQALIKVSQLLEVFSENEDKYRITLSSWKDFKTIPVTNREELSKFFKKNNIQKVFNITATSGSTLSRLLIAHSKEAYKSHEYRLGQMYKQLGIKQGMLCLNLCSYDLNSGGRLMERAFKSIGVGVIPLGPISSSEKVLEAVSLIQKFKPVVINAYTNQLHDLFSVLGRKHSICQCLITGELLWKDYRFRIEKMGGVRIHDHYGAMEISGLAVAIKPEDEYMKVFSKGLLLEVLEDSGNIVETGKGALVVTDLDNYCMPFIRYLLGDRVELIRRKKSLWIKVLGRTEESILINGVVVMKQALIRVVNDFLTHPHFFFIIGKNPIDYGDRLIINIVGEVPENFKVLSSVVKKTLGLDSSVVVRKHKGTVPKTANGKIRYFIGINKG